MHGPVSILALLVIGIAAALIYAVGLVISLGVFLAVRWIRERR